MGAFSIWHWLIVLLPLGVPIIAVATERSEQRLQRLRFVGIVALALAVPVLISVLGRVLMDEMTGGMLGFVVGIIASWFVYRGMVRRARDVGWGKLLPALAIIPVINIVALIVLAVVPGRASAAPEHSALMRAETSDGSL